MVESLSHNFGTHFLTYGKLVNTILQWMADRPESNYAPQYETSHINKVQFSAGDSVWDCILLQWAAEQTLKTKHYITLTFTFKIDCWY